MEETFQEMHASSYCLLGPLGEHWNICNLQHNGSSLVPNPQFSMAACHRISAWVTPAGSVRSYGVFNTCQKSWSTRYPSRYFLALLPTRDESMKLKCLLREKKEVSPGLSVREWMAQEMCMRIRLNPLQLACSNPAGVNGKLSLFDIRKGTRFEIGSVVAFGDGIPMTLVAGFMKRWLH